MVKCRKKALSLVEILIALAMLSTLALPIGMFLIEYVKGSSQLGDYYQILSLVEEKMEFALSMPFRSLPEGATSDQLVESLDKKRKLDLRPAQVGKDLVKFRMDVETVPVEFAAVKDAFSGYLQRARVENGLKKINIIANWGKNGKHSVNLLAYKANL